MLGSQFKGVAGESLATFFFRRGTRITRGTLARLLPIPIGSQKLLIEAYKHIVMPQYGAASSP